MLQKIRGVWFDPSRVVGVVESLMYGDGDKWVRVALDGGDSHMVRGKVDEVAGEINAALRVRKEVRIPPGELKEAILRSGDVEMVAMTHARQCDGRYHYREPESSRCQCGHLKVDLPPLPEPPEREVDADLLEDAHILLCNVSGGNLDMQDDEWRGAWYKFRQKYQDWIRRHNAQTVGGPSMYAVERAMNPPSELRGRIQCEEMVGGMRCQMAHGHCGAHIPYKGPRCKKTWNEYGWIRTCVLEEGHLGSCLENYASEPHKAPLRPGAGKEAEFIDEELRCQPHEHFQMAGKTHCLCMELTGLDVMPYDQLRVNLRPVLQSDPPTLAQRVLNKEALSD